ncbi:MAG TPA: choice-of-anchor Q domain-containing protein [Solirubrobacterales bacterium]|nr:choice-of-anchor Q domain-containing protein [Solirubrobacterales bacterium]
MRLVRSLPLLAVALAVLLPAGSASALSYPVTSTADTDSKGTLRGSIEEANAHMGPDSIPIEVTGTIELASALPGIGDDLTITGPGAASLTVARKPSAPPFTVLQFFGSTATVSGITISGGLSNTGAGILNASGELTLVRVKVSRNEAVSETGGLAGGGGIFSNGTLTLRESLVTENFSVSSGGTENVAVGGGVETEGTLFVELSTISDNRVEALAGGEAKAEAIGGGLAVALSSSTTIVEESTISGNVVLAADATDFAVARGGGIGGGTVNITGSTIADNGAELDAAGASISSAAGDNLAVPNTGIVRNSLVAVPGGEGKNCANGLVSGGFNLDEDGSCGFAKSSDLTEVSAGLDPLLRDNGGPTPTHALLPGSIAIDRGNSFGSSVDQRGLPRPSDFPEISNKEGGNGSDIGAFELQVPPPPGAGAPVLVSQTPGDTTAPNTRIVKGPPRSTFKTKAKFRFASTEPQSHFQCKLDKKKWKACGNPFKPTVKPGKHVFKVRAIDRFGNVDPTPARFGWRVKPLGG